jgi:beta-galactosidase GanA
MKKINLTILLVSSMFWGFAQNDFTPNKYVGSPKLYYGVAYYPEAWRMETVDEDIRRMKETNMNVVRMAEFAWSMMEPTEGNFDFQWLHDAIDKLHANGIDVILGTPTATPPIWAAEKYPEIFIVNDDGQSRGHGARRNCSYTNPKYRELSKIIVEAMAREFGNKPGVIGWQTDNEFNIIQDYSIHTRKLWYEWLESRYNTIENLNNIWHTNLWSQRYERFDQIPMPKSDTWHHSSLRLEWDLFNNHQINDYQKIHIEGIRKYSSLPITHDGMPGQKKDYPGLFEDLDFMGVNCYHSFMVYNRVQTNFDRMRGYGKGMHWYLETAPNNSGGGSKGQTWFIHQPPGAMRANLWMNYALGGQGSLFWLWRQQPAGQEMPHGAIMSAWNEPAANYADLQQLGAELNKHSQLLIDAPVDKAKIGVFYSHVNDLGLRIEESSNNIKYYQDWTENFYTPVSNAFLHRDVIHESVPLDDYDVLLAPLMPMITKELSARLEAWVKNGGILIAGPMTAYRTEYWAAHTDKALGWMEDWMGIGVKSRVPIDVNNRPFDDNPAVSFMNALENLPDAECKFWSEALFSQSGTTLASYKNGMQKDQPAIIENEVGKGKVVLLGTHPGEDAYQQLVMKYAREKNIQPLATGSNNVLVVPRTNREGKTYHILVNLNNTEARVELTGRNLKDVISGQAFRDSEISLKPFDVMIIDQ